MRFIPNRDALVYLGAALRVAGVAEALVGACCGGCTGSAAL